MRARTNLYDLIIGEPREILQDGFGEPDRGAVA